MTYSLEQNPDHWPSKGREDVENCESGAHYCSYSVTKTTKAGDYVYGLDSVSKNPIREDAHEPRRSSLHPWELPLPLTGRRAVGEEWPQMAREERVQGWNDPLTKDVLVLWLQMLDHHVMRVTLRKGRDMKDLLGHKERKVMQHRMRVSKRMNEIGNFMTLSGKGKKEMMRELYAEAKRDQADLMERMREVARGKKMDHMMRVSKREDEWRPKEDQMMRVSMRDQEWTPKEDHMMRVSKKDEEWTPKEDHMLRVSKRGDDWRPKEDHMVRMSKRGEEWRPREDLMMRVSKADDEWRLKEDHMMRVSKRDEEYRPREEIWPTWSPVMFWDQSGDHLMRVGKREETTMDQRPRLGRDAGEGWSHVMIRVSKSDNTYHKKLASRIGK